MFTKTLFVALAIFMVVGAIAAEEIAVEKRGIGCTCGSNGKRGTWWLIGGPSHNCCKGSGLAIGKCCW
ncbi:delta-actitoxin-Avd1c 4-like isoform X1 [Tubulanus polymorphus]|uniref:delta-actitoxin-Avd1c 4-like isoform X1 n=1 Tax=Tubulanus polymorphus TaxID=672921 RepID=UPI003DA22F50